MENDPPFPTNPLERAILFQRNRASVARRTGFTALADDLDARAKATEDVKSLLQQMLFIAENCDETGYVDGHGFVDTDKVFNEVRALLEAK